MDPLPPTDPLHNLKEFFFSLSKIILALFPALAVGLVLAFLAVIAILLFLLQGTSVSP